ncbi:MAG TPA: ATP synthase subunit I [Nevskiaceae bacterium]|nr:ATP synthase subunit I [Nevskiaceae bacterium]
MLIALRIARYQLLAGLLIGVIVGLLSGWMEALAAAAGGGASALLTWYTGVKTFGRGSTDPTQMVMDFYRAQWRKWLLAILVFGLAVQVFKTSFLPFIAVFAGTLSLYWFALLWKDADNET